MTCAFVVVELRGFEPLTPCMPYTDLQVYDDGLRLSTCQYRCPLGTVIDRCLAAPRRPQRRYGYCGAFTASSTGPS